MPIVINPDIQSVQPLVDYGIFIDISSVMGACVGPCYVMHFIASSWQPWNVMWCHCSSRLDLASGHQLHLNEGHPSWWLSYGVSQNNPLNVSLRNCKKSIVLRHIYTTSEISLWASESELRRNQNKWIDVSCLYWFESVSEIFVSDVRVRARHYM